MRFTSKRRIPATSGRWAATSATGDLPESASEGERTQVAQSCVRNLGIRFPALIDGIDNTVERLYTGWPDRLYLIDREGRIAYKSAPGPFGFHPEPLDDALSVQTAR